jgi:hypothetical protein
VVVDVIALATQKAWAGPVPYGRRQQLLGT